MDNEWNCNTYHDETGQIQNDPWTALCCLYYNVCIEIQRLQEGCSPAHST